VGQVEGLVGKFPAILYGKKCPGTDMASIAIATNVTNVRSLRTQDNVEYMYTTSSELDVDWIHLWIGLASVG